MKKRIITLLTIPFFLVTVASCSQKKDGQSENSNHEWEVTHMEEVKADDESHLESSRMEVGDTLTTPSGLKYIITTQGSGDTPKPGQTVNVHYTGYLTDGSKFDSSVDRGQPLSFIIGKGQVIRGWHEGIALLNPGSKARLIIPHELGYGERGMPPVIPPGATLIFDVELVGIQ